MATELAITLKRLHTGQKEVIAHPARYKVVNCGRRWGKTTLAIDILVNQMLDGKRTAYFAPTWKMSSEVWRELKRVLADVATYKNEQERRLEIYGGGFVECWSLENENSVRGRSYHTLIVDEAAMVPDLESAWTQALSPLLTDTEGGAYFFSTPKGHNYFHTAYMRGLDQLATAWQSWEYATVDNPHIKAREVELQRQQLPDRAFRQEYLAEFLDDAGGVFRGVDAVSTLKKAEPIPGHEYVMGVDWGMSYDFTVLAVIDATTKQQVDIDRFNQIGWEVQRARLQTMAEKWGVSTIVVEDNSFGDPNFAELQKMGLPVMRFHTGPTTKKPLIEALALAIEKQDITLLDDPVQKAELKAYQMERTPSGNWKYNAPAGGHDDTVIGLALAWHGVAQGSFIYFMVG